MHINDETYRKAMHEIMQPLNIIRLTCSNMHARISTSADIDVEYLLQKIARIEEQTTRTTQLLLELKPRLLDAGKAGDA